ncbi:hypothetical protein Slin_3098 [Spirosoma linguale DSM 74]|uniref:Uncharacterized protein n=1 Tax=Spirosoma linguale (strain ATCC 33905 / DSM 74 / LMG 10896 / Claus 1) TaxID=504472 RepID=D2QLG2_SPILD|nr:hypothetical protein Slin_3098 [Spirosoma linguale DSM 74]
MAYTTIQIDRLQRLDDYLKYVQHRDLTLLHLVDGLHLVEATIFPFNIFLADVMSYNQWRRLLKSYSYDLFSRLNRPQWHVDWIFRSLEFCQSMNRIVYPDDKTFDYDMIKSMGRVAVESIKL